MKKHSIINESVRNSEQNREKEKEFWNNVSKQKREWIKNTSKEGIIKNILSQEHWWENLIGKIKEKKILDIGCGDTYFATYWQLTRNEACGCDFAAETVNNNNLLHKKLGLKQDFYVASSEKIEAEDEYFDVVHMRWVIHHIPEELQDSSMQEIKRVLVRGGKLIVFETNYLYPFRWLIQTPAWRKYNPFRNYAIKKGWLDPEEKALTNQGYLELLERNGFRIIAKEYDSTFFYYPVSLLIKNKLIKRMTRRLDLFVAKMISNKFSKDIKIIAEK